MKRCLAVTLAAAGRFRPSSGGGDVQAAAHGTGPVVLGDQSGVERSGRSAERHRRLSVARIGQHLGHGHVRRLQHATAASRPALRRWCRRSTRPGNTASATSRRARSRPSRTARTSRRPTTRMVPTRRPRKCRVGQASTGMTFAASQITSRVILDADGRGGEHRGGPGPADRWTALSRARTQLEPDDLDGYDNPSQTGAAGGGWGLTQADSAGLRAVARIHGALGWAGHLPEERSRQCER